MAKIIDEKGFMFDISPFGYVIPKVDDFYFGDRINLLQSSFQFLKDNVSFKKDCNTFTTRDYLVLINDFLSWRNNKFMSWDNVERWSKIVFKIFPLEIRLKKVDTSRKLLFLDFIFPKEYLPKNFPKESFSVKAIFSFDSIDRFVKGLKKEIKPFPVRWYLDFASERRVTFSEKIQRKILQKFIKSSDEEKICMIETVRCFRIKEVVEILPIIYRLECSDKKQSGIYFDAYEIIIVNHPHAIPVVVSLLKDDKRYLNLIFRRAKRSSPVVAKIIDGMSL